MAAQSYSKLLRAIKQMGKDGNPQQGQDTVDNFINANPKRESAMQGLQRMQDKMLASNNGRSVRRNMDGSVVDPTAPTGVDWVNANGPQRDSVKQRQQQMQQDYTAGNANAFAAGREAIAAKKATNGFSDESGNFQIPTLPTKGMPQVKEQNGVKMAFDARGNPVGFAGGPVDKMKNADPGYATPQERDGIQGNINAMLKQFSGAGKNSQQPQTSPPSTYAPMEQVADQGSQSGLAPWMPKGQESGGYMMEDLRRPPLQPSSIADQREYGKRGPMGLKSRTPFTPTPIPSFGFGEVPELPDGLWPAAKSIADLAGHQMKDFFTEMVLGNPSHTSDEAKRRVWETRQAQLRAQWRPNSGVKGSQAAPVNPHFANPGAPSLNSEFNNTSGLYNGPPPSWEVGMAIPSLNTSLPSAPLNIEPGRPYSEFQIPMVYPPRSVPRPTPQATPPFLNPFISSMMR